MKFTQPQPRMADEVSLPRRSQAGTPVTGYSYTLDRTLQSVQHAGGDTVAFTYRSDGKRDTMTTPLLETRLLVGTVVGALIGLVWGKAIWRHIDKKIDGGWTGRGP